MIDVAIRAKPPVALGVGMKRRRRPVREQDFEQREAAAGLVAGEPNPRKRAQKPRRLAGIGTTCGTASGRVVTTPRRRCRSKPSSLATICRRASGEQKTN